MELAYVFAVDDIFWRYSINAYRADTAANIVQIGRTARLHNSLGGI